MRAVVVYIAINANHLFSNPVDPLWNYDGREDVIVKEREVINLVKKRDMAYIVSNGARVTLNAADISKVAQSSIGLDDVDIPAVGAIAVIDGGKMTYLHGSITTSDTPGQYAYVGGEDSEFHIQYTSLSSSSLVSYGLVSTHAGTVHARAVNVSQTGHFDCAFSTGNGGNAYLTEFDTKSSGALACSFDRESSIRLDHVVHVSDSWPVLFLRDDPTVVIANSKLSNNLQGRPVICNHAGPEETPGAKIEVVNSRLLAPINGAIFELRSGDAQVWLTHTEVKTELADFIWARCSLYGSGDCENRLSINVNIADSEISGDAVAWDNSVINISLDPYSSWTGSTAWPASSGPSVNVIVDGTWELTRDTYVQELISRRPNLDNIHSNGHNVYYNPAADANAYLNGNEIALPGGGYAKPYVFEVSGNSDLSEIPQESENIEIQAGEPGAEYTVTVTPDGQESVDVTAVMTTQPTELTLSAEPSCEDSGDDFEHFKAVEAIEPCGDDDSISKGQASKKIQWWQVENDGIPVCSCIHQSDEDGCPCTETNAPTPTT